MDYQVIVRVGEHVWVIDQADGEVEDDVLVLDGLKFGWSLPKGLWPAQPNSMSASLTINVPAFVDASDINNGDPVAIEVYLDDTLIAPFYGRVTDAKAIPRGDDEPGVLLSIVAVDPIVDLAERPKFAPFPFLDPPPDYDSSLADQIFLALGSGALGVLPWTSPSRPMTVPLGQLDLRAALAQILLQAVDGTDYTRMILSPVIDPMTRLLVDDGTRYFTLDTVTSIYLPIFATPYEVPTAHRDDFEWSNVKGQAPGRVAVTGYDDAGSVVDALAAGEVLETAVTESLTVSFVDSTSAQAVADFYANPNFDHWQIDTVTIPVTRANVADLPADLFPHWEAPDGDPLRAACYGKFISAAVDADLHPQGATTVLGVLIGAALQITAGELTVTLTIRRPEDD